jgi:hypothetical protein
MTSHSVGHMVWLFALLVWTAQADKVLPVGEAARQAVEQSQLTLAGSTPFRLKATIADPSNPQYRAEVEEYWVSPSKWRRSIQSPQFSQVLIINGDKVSEQDKGNYYPFWLHDLVTAMFDPVPMLEQLKYFPGAVELPSDSLKSVSCLDAQTHAGVPPAQVALPLSFCFQGKNGLLKSVSTPGYRAEFQDYRPFKKKQVAWKIINTPQHGTTITAQITELAELTNPDENLFTVEQATPPAQQIKSVQVGEDTARRIAVNAPEIAWPSVREGKTSGVLALYISADRSGHLREAWPLSSDNPDITDAAREQVLRWQFQTYVNGIPMQMESVLVFAFNTKIENPIPMLDDAQARKLATHVVEPAITPAIAGKATKFTVRIGVDESGKVLSVQNPNHVPQPVYAAIIRALRQWQFRLYSNNGKPDRFNADLTFHVRVASKR